MARQDGFKNIKDRSPLKASPLRVAGQSLDEAMQKVREDDVTDGAAFVAMGIVIALFEWSRWAINAPPQPVLISALSACMGGYGVWRVARARRVLHQLRQGRDGERAVAEILERFREAGFRVFHDLTAVGFNVDHVLVGPQGL